MLGPEFGSWETLIQAAMAFPSRQIVLKGSPERVLELDGIDLSILRSPYLRLVRALVAFLSHGLRTQLGT